MLNQFRLRHGFFLSYLLPLLCVVVMGAYIQYRLDRAAEATSELLKTSSIASDIPELNEHITRLMQSSFSYVLLNGQASLGSVHPKKVYEDSVARVDLLFVSVDKKDAVHRNTTHLAELRQITLSIQNITGRLMSLADAKRQQEAIQVLKDSDIQRLAIEKNRLIEMILHEEDAFRTQMHARLDQEIKASRKFNFYGLVLSAVLFVGLGSMLIFSLIHSMNKAAGRITSTASDITREIIKNGRGLMAQVSSVNQTTSAVEELVSSARMYSDQAKSASVTAKSVQQTTLTGLDIANRSQEAIHLVEQRMIDFTHEIDELSDQVSQIGGISRSMGEFSREIHMLAVNAAVAAARSGEHGKGFSFIVTAIQNLSDQSKRASEKAHSLTASIQKLTTSMVMSIEDNSKKMKAASESVKETSDAFETVNTSSENSYVNAQQVFLISNEQVKALSMISESMLGVRRGVQEIVSGIDATQTSAFALSNEAVQLRRLI